jgi:hypothetical protein
MEEGARQDVYNLEDRLVKDGQQQTALMGMRWKLPMEGPRGDERGPTPATVEMRASIAYVLA